MTYSEREWLVKKAQEWIGVKKGSDRHKTLLQSYNTAVKSRAEAAKFSPEPRTYQMTVSDPWCATFVSVMGIYSNAKEYPLECSCGQQIKQLMNAGRWEENDGFTPNPGDIIYYDWQDSGKGDNTGAADHVGIVEKVTSGKITVIEGNKSNKVDRRTLSVNGRYIRGFGAMKVETEPKAESKKPAETGGYTGIVKPAIGLNVRTGPGTGYKKLGALKCGTSVVIAAESNGWGKIRYNGGDGWISLEYIKKA